jgi:hypothetical protein
MSIFICCIMPKCGIHDLNVSESSHGIIYALQLCHFYDYMTLYDYNHLFKMIMCAIDLI